MKIHILVLLVVAQSLGVGFLVPVRAQDGNDPWDAPELLCTVRDRLENASLGIRGAITCSPNSPGNDFFFLADHWKRGFEVGDACNCDFDHDGMTGCEEAMLCTNAGDNDSDGDCLADGLEIVLGLDPLSADTDLDGTNDGADDSNGNSIPDGNEDQDVDGLTNCQEVAVGTDPTNPDSDGDGFPDGAEVEIDDLGQVSDPLDPSSLPLGPLVASPPATVVNPSSIGQGAGELAFNTVVLAPPTLVAIPDSVTGLAGQSFNTSVSYPPSLVVIPDSEEVVASQAFNTSVSYPPASVVIPDSVEGLAGQVLNTNVAYPPASVVIPTSEEPGDLNLNTTWAYPPSRVEFEPIP